MTALILLAMSAMVFVAFLAFSCCAPFDDENEGTMSDDASGFVVLTDVVPDLILEMRYHSTYNFLGRRVPGYDEPVALMTREAAEALKRVSDIVMLDGFRIRVYDAYRPQMAVTCFASWLSDPSDVAMKSIFYPTTDKSELNERGYISMRSSHTRGSALDLTLVDAASGVNLDMGGPFDYFGERSHSAWTEGLTKEQRENRVYLRETMTRNGFSGIRSEWWHFRLTEEPYPDTYFTFPVRTSSVRRNV